MSESPQIAGFFITFLLRKKSLIFVVRMYYRPGPLVHLYWFSPKNR
jgi:hypothetical protein